jgi:hypothetical protein
LTRGERRSVGKETEERELPETLGFYATGLGKSGIAASTDSCKCKKFLGCNMKYLLACR